MKFPWLTVIFFTLFLCVTSANAAPSCQSIFSEAPTLADVLQHIDQENNFYLFQQRQTSEYISEYSWWRKRKIRKILQRTELEKIPSAESVENFAIELGEALFGSNKTADRLILKNSQERLQESVVLQIKEKILTQGLKEVWQNTHDPDQVHRIRKAVDALYRLQNKPLMQLLRLPWALPQVHNQKLPPEFIEKVIRDGYNAHADEARVLLNSQSHREAYETFRRLYTPVVMGVMMIFTVSNALDQQDALVDQQVNQTVQEMREMRQNISNDAQALKADILKTAIEATIKEFTEKFGEPPTDLERAQIKDKIQRSLSATNS